MKTLSAKVKISGLAVGEILKMDEFLKCECSHCGQPIEYPSEGIGQIVPCPTCEKPITLPSAVRREGFFYETPAQEAAHEKPVALTPENQQAKLESIAIPLAPAKAAPAFTNNTKEEKTVRTNLSKLTEETIRKKTQAGDTPLHRAARIGRIFEIPVHLLSIELLTAKNNNGDTPLHLAARFGVLNQIPRQFLTKETLTMKTAPPRAPNGVYFTGSGYEARTPTVLHDAASSGHADQIPKEFLIPEFLLIEATGHQQTVLEHIIKSERLDVLPKDFSNFELWNLKDSNGQTPRRIFEMLMERETQLAAWRVEDQSGQSYVSRVRSEPATEKQKEKLRYFGYAFDEKISKGQASDALDKCARDFPEVDQTYYNRPATKEQLAKLREINDHPDCGPDEPFYDFENEGPLTYGKAKDLIQEWGWLQRTKEREKEAEEIGIMHFTSVTAKTL